MRKRQALVFSSNLDILQHQMYCKILRRNLRRLERVSRRTFVRVRLREPVDGATRACLFGNVRDVVKHLQSHRIAVFGDVEMKFVHARVLRAKQRPLLSLAFSAHRTAS